MRFCKTLFLVCICLAYNFSSIKASASEDEIGNLIIQKTMSLVGHEFYREFSSLWTTPPGVDTFNICVQEKADARWGSLITVLVDDRVVYKKVLGLRTRDMEETAKEAVAQVRAHILRMSLMDQTNDEDMAGNGY